MVRERENECLLQCVGPMGEQRDGRAGCVHRGTEHTDARSAKSDVQRNARYSSAVIERVEGNGSDEGRSSRDILADDPGTADIYVVVREAWSDSRGGVRGVQCGEFGAANSSGRGQNCDHMRVRDQGAEVHRAEEYSGRRVDNG